MFARQTGPEERNADFTSKWMQNNGAFVDPNPFALIDLPALSRDVKLQVAMPGEIALSAYARAFERHTRAGEKARPGESGLR